MAALQQQKRPSISNWFSSLRRQPKAVKAVQAAALYGPGDKHYQRSCIDLSTSTFYIPQCTQTDQDGNNSTDNLLDCSAKDKSKLKLCMRCCCTIPSTKSTSQAVSSPVKNLYSSAINEEKNTSSPLKTEDSNHCNGSETNSPASISVITSTLEHETKLDKQVNVAPAAEDFSSLLSTTCSPVTPLTSSSPITLTTATHIIHKTSEFCCLSKVRTTTQTVIMSRVLLNEKSKTLEKTARSNSLGCVLDDTSDQPMAPLDVMANDIQFIDEISTPHSQYEHYTPPNGTTAALENQVSVESGNFYTTSRSMSVSTPRSSAREMRKQHLKQGLHFNNNNNTYSHHNHNHNNNNNLDDLCENCRHVIERNLNNRSKQQHLKKHLKYNAVICPSSKQIKDELCEVVTEMEALDVPEDCKHSNKDKQMSIGRKKFNMDPKKGIEYLVENRLLRHDPQDVAHFLYKGEGLNKTAIGDYLGENNDFNKDVLKAFVALHDFTNLILVQALRQFLWSFRLPGEAQKIDRMMECFAQRYCQLNPDIFTNTDTCYVLSFAIIMLNTSLHNPSVKDKPTVEQFISMNRGINNGGDLPRTLLESLYESIRTEPFKIPQDDGNDLMHTFFNPDKEGWLWKQGGRYKSWKRRWFILNDNCLYYFEYTTDKEPRGIIPLENISVREIHDRSKPNCFELFATGGADIIKACKTDSEGKVVEGKHTVYRMSAATAEEQQDWIKRLTQSISHNPFYDILVQRKKKALSKS